MAFIFDTLHEITTRVSSLHAITDIAALTDDDLKTFIRLTSELRQHTDRVLAFEAAEIHQRSRRELGGASLTKTSGHVNPQSLIASLTGATKADARKLDHLGKSLMDASPAHFPAIDASGEVDSAPVVRPWFASITDRMTSGEINPDRYDALRTALGNPNDAITAEALAEAAHRILGCLHPEDSPEVVYRDAIQARAFLDRAAVLDNENALRAKQEAKIWVDRDGMVHLRAVFAPEDGTWFKNTLDLILGPKIGGPRFVHGAAATMMKTIEDDPRSTDQIRASMIVELLRAGALVDENTILAQKRPTVQIVVTASELTRPDNDGIAFIEGTGIPVSIATIDRLVCETGYVTSLHGNDGSPLDLGREVRLYSPKQRVMIAGLQGGCSFGSCDAPPAFCEVHHINPWATGGKTNILDGIMLCRHHHMHLHNHGDRITRVSGQRYEDSYYYEAAPTKSLPGHTPATNGSWKHSATHRHEPNSETEIQPKRQGHSPASDEAEFTATYAPQPARRKLRFRGVAHNNAQARSVEAAHA